MKRLLLIPLLLLPLVGYTQAIFNVCIRGGLNPSPLGEDLSIVCEDGALQKKQPQPLRSKDSLSMDNEVSQTCFAWRGWSCAA